MVERITIYDVSADRFNKVLAETLKSTGEFSMPEWAYFIKTGASRARPPQENDWWYKRVASILRHIYRKGVIGVNRLKTRYGGKKDRGMRPSEFRKGSGKIIRVILQQSEKAGLIEKTEGKKKGRQLTKKGLDFLNQIAEKVLREKGEKI